MANQNVKEWLQTEPAERDYKQGVALFKSLKIDKKKNDFFDIDEPTMLHKNQLLAALVRYNRIHNQKTEAKEKAADDKKQEQENKITPSANLTVIRDQVKTVLKDIENGQVVYSKKGLVKPIEQFPEELQELYKSNQDNVVVIRSKHEKIKLLSADAKADEERKTLINEILELQKGIKENWVKLDAHQHGSNDGGNGGTEFTQPEKASGAFTKEEIEQITDDVMRAKCKDMRIEADLAYVRRNADNEKKKAEVEKRIAELVAWEVDYESRIGTNNAAGTGE